MKPYNIETGNLYTDLDTPFDKDNNKIDVYSSVYWTAENEKEYTEKEGIIHNWNFENDLIKCNTWCDISGFDYWVVRQQEENYVPIDVCLKKPHTEYSQKEIISISQVIIEADNYFQETLTQF